MTISASALFKASREGDSHIIKKAIAEGVDITLKGFSGESLLHHASSNLHYSVARLLLKNGIAYDIKDSSGNTPSDWASMSNEMRMGCPNESARDFINWMKEFYG